MSSVPPSGFKLKGTAVRGTLQAIEKLHGAPGRMAVEQHLPEHLRALLGEELRRLG